MDRFVGKYNTFLDKALTDLLFENCEGCELDLGNQLGHTCVTFTYEERVATYFEDAFEKIDVRELLADLKRALKQHMIGEKTDDEQQTPTQEETNECEVSSSTK